MKKLLIIAILFPLSTFAQKFLVIEDDTRINKRIADRITNLGYTVVKSGDEADYIAQMIYEKKKGYMSFRTGWANKEYKYNKIGYVAFLSAKGDTLTMTDEQGGMAKYYNTYSALSELTNKILKKDFNSKLKEAVKTFVQTTQPKSSQTSKVDELAKLKKLLDGGALTKEEFETEKKKLLNN